MAMLNTAAQSCLKAFKWMAIAVVVLIAAVFAINAFDESLKPEAAAALRWPEPTANDADNGYFVLVGLSAPAGQDAHAWGRRWVEAMNRAGTRTEVEAAERSLATAPLKFAGSSAVLCDFRSEQACAPQANKHAEAIGKLSADNAELLRRYAALRHYSQVIDTYRPQSLAHPIIGLAIYNNAQRLVLSQLLADADRDAGGPALTALAADIDMQRRLLAGAISLIVKMTANAALARDYLALAELVRRHPALAGNQADTMKKILAPLDKAELALAPAMMSEFRGMAASLDDPAIADPASYQLIQVLGDASAVAPGGGAADAVFVPATTPTIERPLPRLLKASALDALLNPVLKGTIAVLLQKNATRNDQYATLHAFAALDDVPASALAEAERSLSVQQDRGVTWTWLYNPVGKLIQSVAVPNFADYKRRLLDLEGLRRLIVLQTQIAAGAIADADIPAFLARTDAALADPYTGKPMGWDAGRRALVFVAARNSRWFVVGKDGRIVVPI